MSDTRELVLVRLLEIGQEMRADGFLRTVDRNKLDFSEQNLPQFVLLDADEHGNPDDKVRTGRAGRAALRRVEMTPQVFLCAKGLSEVAGSTLNGLRAEWLRRVLTDAQLMGYLGENGYMHYAESVSSFRIGRQLDSTMLVTVDFGYILNPTAL